jgi:uncharacterized protein (TIGR01777 family)
VSHPTSILITGATGLVGSTFIKLLQKTQPDRAIHILTRNPQTPHRVAGVEVKAFGWSPSDQWMNPMALEGVSHIFHLAGEPVAQRWTYSARQRIRDSRTGALTLLQEACKTASLAPRIVSASAVGFYASGPENRTEDDPAGTGFLSEVVQEWEMAAAALGALGGGHVQFRIGLVLSARGGVLKRLLPIYRMGLGAPLASGRQFQSWIHVEDLASMLTEALDHSEWSGAYNAVSPEVVSQRQFSRALAAALRRPHFFPAVPAWAIRLWFGKAAEALLASHNITPSRLLELGFKFRFPTLETAFESAVTDA